MTTTITQYKVNNQITYVPKNVAPLANGTLDATTNSNYNYIGNWYPKARPLKLYRKRGSTYSLGTDATYVNCENDCSNVELVIGKEFKLLGKDANGQNKELRLNPAPLLDASNCLISNPTRGPKGTKSAGAKIRSSTTLIPQSKDYYTNSKSYLQSRSKTYENKLYNTNISGHSYYDADGNYIHPTDNLSTTSSHFHGHSKCDPDNVTNKANCKITVYKPNNQQYGVQGAVDSSSRLERLKLNTITKNYSTFYKTDTWGTTGYSTTENPNIHYTGNPVAPYFIKSKVTKPKIFHRQGSKQLFTNCAGGTGGKVGFTMTFF